MKKVNGKRLDNKGFTLIELLAVIVILAVVMGVATTSVLTSMNNSRKSSLQNSAVSAADAFRTAYAEASLNNSTTVYGLNIPTATGKVALNQTAADFLHISASNYDLTNSFVYFDFANSKVEVCMVANKNGSYYVADADAATGSKKNQATNLGTLKITTSMWACSNGKNSWT